MARKEKCHIHKVHMTERKLKNHNTLIEFIP